MCTPVLKTGSLYLCALNIKEFTGDITHNQEFSDRQEYHTDRQLFFMMRNAVHGQSLHFT